MAGSDKRERLIQAAGELFHKFGLFQTSLADIAKHARIPIGNVYYYFKTKEELALASIDRRRTDFQTIYQRLDETTTDPRQRLINVVTYFDHVREEYTRYGCPSCAIIMAGDVSSDPVVKAAANLFADFVDWAQKQFQLLGHGEESRAFAITLSAGIQGSIILAKAFADPHLLSVELARLASWLNNVPNKKLRLGKVALMPAEN